VSIITFALHLRIKFLKQRTKDQQELSRKLLESQEDERKRIGSGLHDSIGQNLLVIKNLAVVGLEANKSRKTSDEQLDEISLLASQSLSEVREISYNLRPYHLDQLGLTGALRSIISRIASSSQIIFSEDLDDLDDLFPKESEINVFRIVQEAVNNIIKHSRAKNANIKVKRDEGSVRFTLSDNGIGFDSSRQGFGLTGMAERVRILGGSLAIKSGGGTGTTITVIIPIRSENDGE
jgi:signal transduction histidine kinase